MPDASGTPRRPDVSGCEVSRPPSGIRYPASGIRHSIARPGGLSALTARGFLESLCEKNVSWSWMAGDNIRAVQESLGHHSIKTALRYQDCLPPKAAGPADLFPDSCPLRCR